MQKYPKIQGVHKEEAKGFDEGYIIVEEKVDGSQFRIQIDDQGIISIGSHNVDNIHETGSNGFAVGIENALKIFEGVKADPGENISVFGEFLAKPKQNTIAYQRVPNHNIVVFDVVVNGKYLDREEKERFAFGLGLEVVPILWKGEGKDFTDEIREKLLKSTSFLGHQAGYDKVEGIVIKNYGKLYDERYRNLEGKHMTIKIVNASFQEKNKVENPGQGDKLETLVNTYTSEARWRKSIQHKLEDDELEFHMRDMAKLAPAVVQDIEEEERETIKEELWKIMWPKIKGRAVKGFPEFYMKYLEERNNDKQ
ncbi:RNA ligase family protein [Nitrosopumilus sp.]|uniref:RNA ligase family protein n=1 Tax=Nitrosopumilus sp. TaxID=2024843 RepID=UPI003D14A74A